MPVLIVVHLLSFGIMGVFLTIFARVLLRRRLLVQSLAVTSDDDEMWLLRWRRTERRQVVTCVAYVVSVVLAAVGSVSLYLLQPHIL